MPIIMQHHTLIIFHKVKQEPCALETKPAELIGLQRADTPLPSLCGIMWSRFTISQRATCCVKYTGLLSPPSMEGKRSSLPWRRLSDEASKILRAFVGVIINAQVPVKFRV